MEPTVTFALTDAEARAVLYACSVATERPSLWNGNVAHQMAAVAARAKMVEAYDAQAVVTSRPARR